MSIFSIITIIIMSLFLFMFLCSIVGNMKGRGGINWYFIVVIGIVILTYIGGYTQSIRDAELMEVSEDHYIISYRGSLHIYEKEVK